MVVGPFHPLRGGIAHFNARLWRELGGHPAVRAVSFRRQYPAVLFPGRTQYDPGPQTADGPAAWPLIDSVGPRSWLGAARTIRALRPRGVLFAQWTPAMAPAYGVIARAIGRRPGPRRILVCHNLHPHEPGPADRWLIRFLVRASDGAIALSRVVEREIRLLAPGLAVEYVPHPIVDAFAGIERPSRSEARTSLGLPGEALVLLFFGYVRAYKGLDVAFEALAHLQRSGWPVHLLVAGEFYEERARYDRLAAALGIAARLTVIDRYLPDGEVPRLFAAADACVLPYRSGTQSGVAKVAWQYGLPVIASTVGGLAEDVAEGRTGFTCRAGDAQDLARAAERFFAARMSIDLSGEIARARNRFGWGPLVTAVERLVGRPA